MNGRPASRTAGEQTSARTRNVHNTSDDHSRARGMKPRRLTSDTIMARIPRITVYKARHATRTTIMPRRPAAWSILARDCDEVEAQAPETWKTSHRLVDETRGATRPEVLSEEGIDLPHQREVRRAADLLDREARALQDARDIAEPVLGVLDLVEIERWLAQHPPQTAGAIEPLTEAEQAGHIRHRDDGHPAALQEPVKVGGPAGRILQMLQHLRADDQVEPVVPAGHRVQVVDAEGDAIL